MDMAGFAVNLGLFFQYPDVEFSNYVKRGYQESTLLSGMKITLNDLEPLADNCSKVSVLTSCIRNHLHGVVVRASARGVVGRSSIPGSVVSKDIKRLYWSFPA